MKNAIISAMISTTIFAINPAFAMEDKDNEGRPQKTTQKAAPARKEIEFRGKKKTALAFIMGAVINPQKDPFSATEVIRFEESTRSFDFQGTLRDLSKEDLEASVKDIKEGNFVYTNYKMNMNGIGEFIVGTSDEEVANRLHFSYMDSLLGKKGN